MFADLVKKNRSYRGFDENVKMSRDDLAEFVEMARYTASGANLQPLKYRLVPDEAETAQLNKATRWAKMLKDIELPHPGHYPVAYIVICLDTELCANPEGAALDIGIAAQTILLGAVEKGFGGCMLGNYERTEIAAVLKLDSRFVPRLLIALGKPVENVKLVEAENGDIKYYRDANDIHYVPKRSLTELLID